MGEGEGGGADRYSRKSVHIKHLYVNADKYLTLCTGIRYNYE